MIQILMSPYSANNSSCSRSGNNRIDWLANTKGDDVLLTFIGDFLEVNLLPTVTYMGRSWSVRNIDGNYPDFKRGRSP